MLVESGLHPSRAAQLRSPMEHLTKTMFRVGDWRVDPTSGEISRSGETVRLEARTLRLLLCLAEHSGQVVSIDDLLNQVWSGVTVTSDSVYQSVASLRRTLGDDSKQPTYIATVPRLGYRMVATVSPWVTEAPNPDSKIVSTSPSPRLKTRSLWIGGIAAFLGLISVFVVYSKVTKGDHSVTRALAAPPPRSIAVLPFLDLTEGMHEETFSDGMTEELIDKFSKIQGLQVAAPTSSFYFKDKQVPIADIAKALNVSYVVDGSVRQSGTRLRVAARLVRADSGYVVWSETYDRPFDDRLMVQDDIAGEVAKALQASIAGGQR
jgi:transcriptional activator of cad operon